MPVSIKEMNELNSKQNYALFHNTNLHVHTPCTAWDWDSQENQITNASEITPEYYFDKLNRTNLELVAITDHNCVLWCNQLIDLAKKARSEGRSKLHILPGIELTTYEGPHLIAIFDEDISMIEVNNMLIRLGLSGEGKKGERVNSRTAQGEITIFTILDEITNLGGLAIGPHIHQKDGLWGPKEFRGRIEVLNDERLRILAAPSGEIKRVTDSQKRVRLLFKNMDSTLIRNSFAFINVADCHRIEDFEKNTTWIKMTSPNLNGIKQIIFEPELRVSHEIVRSEEKVEFPDVFIYSEPMIVNHPYIMSMAISGGMLNDLRVSFSPHQNCIIGRNYAGKSALLDCLRFALNSVPHDIDLQDKFSNRLLAFISEGGEVRVYVNQCGKIYGISRVFSLTQIGRGINSKKQIEGQPEIFSIIKDEFRRESDLRIENIFNTEVYPQGEVVKIKDNANQQIKLVNSLARIDTVLQELTQKDLNGDLTIFGSLEENSKEIILETERKTLVESEVLGLDQLEKEIKDLEELTSSPLFSEKKQWASTGVILDTQKRDLLKYTSFWTDENLLPIGQSQKSESVNHIEESKNEDGEIDYTKASPQEYLTFGTNKYNETINILNDNLQNSKAILDSSLKSISTLEEEREKREKLVEVEINKGLDQSDQGVQEGSLIDRITEKQKRLNILNQKKAI